MFVSAFFLVFLGIVSMLFFLLPVKFRQLILLVSSYVFCGFVEVRALVVLIFISFFTWAAGLKIEKLRVQGRIFFSKTGTVAVTVFFCSLLCGYKYLPSFFRYCGMDSRLPESVAGQFIMPVGLSFYLFQAIGYLVDIYKGKSQRKNRCGSGSGLLCGGGSSDEPGPAEGGHRPRALEYHFNDRRSRDPDCGGG